MTSEEMLAVVRGTRTDLARVVRAAARDRAPRPRPVPHRLNGGVRRWQERGPGLWARVSLWIASRGKPIIVVCQARERRESDPWRIGRAAYD